MTKDGRTIHTRIGGSPIQDSDGSLQGSFGIISDLTERKQSQERVEHLNRVLRAIRDVNQLIVSEKDRDVLIERACEILIETRGYQHAWIALLDDSGVASSTAEAGLGESFASLEERMAAGDLPACCRRALESGDAVVVDDPLASCGDCPLTVTHGGGTSGVTVRLEHAGKLFGALGLAVPTSHCKDPEEISLVGELAGDLGLALHGIQVEEERQRSIRELAESEQKYRTMLTNLEEGFYNATTDGTLLDHNIAFNRILGFDPTENLVGTRLPNFWQDLADRKPYLEEMARRGAIKGYIINAKKRDGEKIIIQATSRIIEDESNRPVRIEGTFLDVTDRVRAETAQHKSEELLAVTLKSIGDAVIATDRDGCVTFMNQTAEAATGWALSEAAGRPLDEVFDVRNEETGNRVENPVERIFREGVVVGLANHTKLIRRGGGALPIADSGAPVRDDAGNIIGAVLVFQDITGRRKGEGALWLKNQVFEDSIAALSIADTNGIITEVNPAFLTLWGHRTKADATGGSVGSFFVNDKDAGPVLEALGTSGRWEGDFLARRVDGTTFICHGLATAMKNERGELIGYQSANLDVTEQRRAEDEIKLRNRIASIFLSVADDDMYSEVLKVVLDVAQSEFGVFGYIDENGALVVPSMTRHIWDQCQVPEKDIVFPREEWGDSIWPQAIRQKELLFSNSPSDLTPKGHVPVSRNITAPIVHQGEVVGLLQVANKASNYTPDDIRLIETLRDVVAPILSARLERDRQEKERRQREAEIITLNMDLDQRVVERTAALRASEDRLRFIMSAGPGVLYTREAHGDFAATFISENVGEQMGYEAEQFLEGPGFWASRIHPDDAARVFAALPKVFEKGSHEHEYRFLHGNGSYVWMHDSLRLVKDEQDRPVELIGLWMDITEQRRAQEEVERMNVELTAANKELEAFAYSVSHDLRAPLRGIDGFSKALLDDYRDKLDDTAKDYINRVRAGTQRMGRLIDDLLKLSRLTRAEVHHERLDLGEVGRRIASELRRDEPDRRVDFEISPGLTAHGDRALMEAVLENLLCNAWKFTGRSEQARIELGVTEQNGERVYYVRDNGAGFDMAYADKLFGPFQRLHDTTEFPGTGIGLAIVHRVILRHGGRIWAEGEVGEGATFYFTLPIRSGNTGEGAES